MNTPKTNDNAPALRGVNLGGWLLLEKWMTPSLFEGTDATDEYTFSLEDQKNDYSKLIQHRKTFIRKQDFRWLADHGVNAVRIPVGYWALESDGPYLNTQPELDNAFAWAEEYGLKVILDLHGAIGSQNGLDHSGKSGPIEWPKRINRKQTLETLTAFSKRYGSHPNLWGISILNEPQWNVSLRVLRQFYKKSYKAIRNFCSESVAVIISDTFRPFVWNGFMSLPRFKNVILDSHLYQCFSEDDKALDLKGHLHKTEDEWSTIIQSSDKPVIIGEWSLGLDPIGLEGMNEGEREQASATYGAAQLHVFGESAGWFFWNYKCEGMRGWNFRQLVEEGQLRIDTSNDV